MKCGMMIMNLNLLLRDKILEMIMRHEFFSTLFLKYYM